MERGDADGGYVVIMAVFERLMNGSSRDSRGDSCYRSVPNETQRI